MKIKSLFAVALAVLIASVGCTPKHTNSDNPYAVTQKHRERAAALVAQMTIEEKCDYV